MITDAVLARLSEATGGRGLLRAADLAGMDPGLHPENLEAGLAVLPATTAEVSNVLAICFEHGIAVVPQGGRTSLAAACATEPGELIVGLSRMRRIVDLDSAGGTAIVEAGSTLQALDEAAAAHGLSAGIDLHARGSCTIGGMIGTNAGGMEAFRNGTMRQRVLGIEAVLADGRVMSDLTRVLKANQGYDLKQLFIGAEGTLGIVTRAAIKLEPLPGKPAAALAVVADVNAAIALLGRLRGIERARLTHAELMLRNHVDVTARAHGRETLQRLGAGDATLLLEVAAADEGDARAAVEEVLTKALDDRLVADAVIPASERERAEIWFIREDWAVDRIRPGGLWFDVSVPLPAMQGYLDGVRRRLGALDAELELHAIGHLADGNLHVTVNAPRPIRERYGEISTLVYEGLTAAGGAFSAEHGIGTEKRAALLKLADPVKLDMMRAIKRTLDPKGIMNPGKVLPAGA
jgi:FAD/FMN-containing dehydrogenase